MKKCIVIGILFCIGMSVTRGMSTEQIGSNVALVPVEGSVEYYEAILAESQLRKAEEQYMVWEKYGYQCTDSNPCAID
jgi:hypothetical protein